MSFGTLVRMAALPRHVILMFLKAFSSLPQTILLKYEEDLPEASPNVVIKKWLPQTELLGKYVVLYLSHG